MKKKLLGLLMIGMLLFNSLTLRVWADQDLQEIKEETTESQTQGETVQLTLSVEAWKEGMRCQIFRKEELIAESSSKEIRWQLEPGPYQLKVLSSQEVILEEEILLEEDRALQLQLEEAVNEETPTEVETVTEAEEKVEKRKSDEVEVAMSELLYYDQETPAIVSTKEQGDSWFEGSRGKIYMYTDKSSGMAGFCLNPMLEGPSGVTSKVDYYNYYSEEQRQRAELIATLGFYLNQGLEGYSNTQNYIFTQAKLWETLPVDNPVTGHQQVFLDLRFVDEGLGFHQELDQNFRTWSSALEQKMKDYHQKPSFDGQSFNLKVGEEMVLKDEHGRLTDYEIMKNVEGVEAKIQGNELILCAQAATQGELQLSYHLQGSHGVGFITAKEGVGSMPYGYQDLGFFKVESPIASTLTLEVTEPTGKLRLIKKGEGDEAVEGALFQLARDAEMKEIISQQKTDQKGLLEWTDLTPGKYYLQELSVPKPYQCSSTIHPLEIVADKTTEIQLTNGLLRGNIRILKVDAITKEAIENCEIGLFSEAGEQIAVLHTDASGIAECSDLPYGGYYLQELQAAPGYVLIDEKMFFEIQGDGEVLELMMENEPIRGKLRIKKVNEEEEVLAGAVFELYRGDELIHRKSSDESGEVLFEDLAYGEYRVVESESPKGYCENKKSYDISVKQQEEEIQLVITNKRIKGSMRLLKKDAEHEGALAGALIELYTESGELVDSKRTDEKGIAEFQDLEYGSYYLVEKEAPQGYRLEQLPLTFQIEKEGEELTLTMLNRKKPAPLARTGSGSSPMLLLGGGMLLSLGARLAVRSRKGRQ